MVHTLMIKQYQVTETFDPTKDYGQHIPKGIKAILASLEKGKVFAPREIVSQCTTKPTPNRSDHIQVYKGLHVAKDID